MKKGNFSEKILISGKIQNLQIADIEVWHKNDRKS